MKEDDPKTQVRRLHASSIKEKKDKEKKKKGKLAVKRMNHDMRLGKLRRARRAEAEARGIPRSQVESPT